MNTGCEISHVPLFDTPSDISVVFVVPALVAFSTKIQLQKRCPVVRTTWDGLPRRFGRRERKRKLRGENISIQILLLHIEEHLSIYHHSNLLREKILIYNSYIARTKFVNKKSLKFTEQDKTTSSKEKEKKKLRCGFHPLLSN